MTTKSYNEIQFQKMEQTLALVKVIEKVAADLEVEFDSLARLIDDPALKPEFADWVGSLDCKLTLYHPQWYEVGDKSQHIQSFSVLNIVLLRLNPHTEETIWLTLDNLACEREVAIDVNTMFESAWESKTEIDIAELNKILPLSNYPVDSGIEYRRALRGRHHNNDGLAVKLLDEIWRLPQVLRIAQKRLENFVEIVNNVRPTNHLLKDKPRELSINQPPERHYETSSRIAPPSSGSNAVRSTK